MENPEQFVRDLHDANPGLMEAFRQMGPEHLERFFAEFAEAAGPTGDDIAALVLRKYEATQNNEVTAPAWEATVQALTDHLMQPPDPFGS